jgi:hypothetical protein
MSDTRIPLDPVPERPADPDLLAAVTAAVQPQQPAGIVAPPIQREKPEPAPSRAALRDEMWALYEADLKYHGPAFKRMLEDQAFAGGEQYPGVAANHDLYTANIVQRHIKGRVSALYARRPTFTARRRKRLDFKMWDGTAQSLQQAQQAMMPPQPPPVMGPDGAPLAMPPAPPPPGWQPDPMATALLQDVMQGMQRRKLYDRISDTLQIIFSYSLQEQLPDFKESMKQLIRRVETCAVGYVELDYQRAMEKKPETMAAIADISSQLAEIERLTADVQDGVKDVDSADAERLKLMLEQLQKEEEVIAREGLLFHFPAATDIVPDKNTKQLKGFVGASHLHKRMLMTVDDIKKTYEVDVSANFTAYTPTGDQEQRKTWWQRTAPDKVADKSQQLAMVVHTYDKKTGLIYCMAEGYPDFLKKPYPPKLKLERFFPFYALVFNDQENEKELFPASTVRLLRSMQMEYNRTMEARRQHRIANRPVYIAANGALEDEDNANLTRYQAHDVISINGLSDGEDINNKIKPLAKVPIDPNVYEVETIFQDVIRVVGTSEAATGAPNGKVSATGDSIAETNRMSDLASNADDLDELLSMMARDAGQVLLLEMDAATVAKIAGPGAVWPELTRQQVAEEILLEVEAGSSGRPNKTQEIANFERMAPFLQQTPNLNPEWLARYMVRIMDDRIDLDDAVLSGMPSIVAMNANQQAITGDPALAPNAQGPQGADNQEQPQGAAGGAQPAYPGAPAAGEAPNTLT